MRPYQYIQAPGSRVYHYAVPGQSHAICGTDGAMSLRSLPNGGSRLCRRCSKRSAEKEWDANVPRADYLTRKLSAFNSFAELLTARPDYRPTIRPETPEHVELADFYDAAQKRRGDTRRAYRGRVRRKLR